MFVFKQKNVFFIKGYSMNDNENSSDQKLIEDKLKLENAMKGGLSWFYWIAGLSIINTIMAYTKSETFFVAGLSTTFFVKAASSEFSSLNLFFNIINAILIVSFIIFGKYGKKNNLLIYIGMGVYCLDSLFFLYAGEWVSIGFHVFALYGIYIGLKSKNQLSKLNEINAKITPKEDDRFNSFSDT